MTSVPADLSTGNMAAAEKTLGPEQSVKLHVSPDSRYHPVRMRSVDEEGVKRAIKYGMAENTRPFTENRDTDLDQSGFLAPTGEVLAP